MTGPAKRIPVVVRRVNVAAVETARYEKRLTIEELCANANVDPSAYRNLLRWQGTRSRDSVILRVVNALGLSVRDIVTFTPGGEGV
jgi:hypothetical protein